MSQVPNKLLTSALLHSGLTPPQTWSSSTAHISARSHPRTMKFCVYVTKTGMVLLECFLKQCTLK